MKIEDQFGRTFKTLRVSLTNSCNLSCSYCVDSSADKQIKTIYNHHQKVLTTEQYIKIIEVLNKTLSLETVRLTGGEPTLYKGLIPLIKGIHKTGIKNIKMTTNGSLLEKNIIELKNAGLSSVNISLDAIDTDVSVNISKRKKLTDILTGIDKALEAGIKVKVNTVVMRGVNDNQIIKLFDYCKQRNITIRFLELMQMGHLYHNFQQYFYSENEILKTISGNYDIQPLTREVNATSKYWETLDGFTFGIISNESDPFCNDCNRLRLDSYGNIYGCLSNNHPINLADAIEDSDKVKEKLIHALSQKKMKFSGSPLSMLHIGG